MGTILFDAECPTAPTGHTPERRGGAHDRRFFHDILQIAPRMRELPLMTRRWLDRVVRYLVCDAAIDQIVDPAHRLARELENRFVRGLGSGWFRTRERIASLFDGLELVEPGLVEPGDWWPYGPAPRPRSLEERLMLGALGRIPNLRNR
ncbi:SAM-dependent methyltransferase [Nocardia gipuzkoensis]